MTAVSLSLSPGKFRKWSEGLNTWMPRGVLGITMLFTGAAGLIYEYVLSTVFTYLLGSSITQFSVTIGIMFLMMGVGGWVQNRIRGALVEFFIGAELLLVLLGGFSPVALQWAFVVMPGDFGWIKFAYPAAIGLLVGIEIPLVMRINEKYTANLRSNIAGTWALDYVGGALGVWGWIELLKRYVPLTHISFAVAAMNLLVALVSLVFFWKRGLLKGWSRRTPMTLVALGIAGTMFFGASNADAWSKISTQKMYENPIIHHEKTKFQDIVLTEGPHPQDPRKKGYELFLNGNKQFGADERIYHENLVHPAMNMAARHQNVLILGGGDGMALREVLKYKDVQNVTLVDLDPEMIKLATNNPVMKELNEGSFSDARVHSNLTDPALSAGVKDTGKTRDIMMNTGDTEAVACEEKTNSLGRTVNDCTTTPVLKKVASVNVYTVDADQFVSQPRTRYDVVIIDLPDPNSVELAKLYSKEFYQKVKRVTSPDGMIVVQATSPYHAKETFLCILRTMAAAGLNVLPYHDNVPSFGDWGWILGSPSVSDTAMYRVMDTFDSFGVPTEEVEASGMTRTLIFNKHGLTARSSEISTLMNPVVFSYYEYEGWLVN